MGKVLIAEDDKFLATAYKAKLTKAGFEIRVTSDGQEALQALKEFIPDVIILDLVMPVKDGFAVLEELKKDDKLKLIPVIVASNLGQKEDTEKALSLGAIDFIVKSDLSMDELVNKIKQIIAKKAS